MPKEHSLRLKQVSIAVAETCLVKDLSLDLFTGEQVGLLGPSGIGKSTLLRTVGRLIEPAAGTIELDGVEPDELGWPQYRSRVVHVAQRPILLDDTVLANLQRPFLYKKQVKSFREEVAAKLLERLLLEPERLSQRATTLSVGQQQRIGLIRALLLEPDFLLLDEPTSALDEDARDCVEALLAELADEKRLGALVVTHDRQQLERLCVRTVDLNVYKAKETSPTECAAASSATGGVDQ